MTAVASLAGALAALAAVATAGFVARQVREEGHQARFSAGLDSLWHMSEEWNSPPMMDIRSGAAAGLLIGQPTADVDEVLGFFEELGVLVKRGALDEELAALRFYWPMAAYWLASRDHTQRLGRKASSAWEDVGGMVTRLATVEAQRRKRPVAEVLPSDDEVQRFLMDEEGEDQCADDKEARKTPL